MSLEKKLSRFGFRGKYCYVKTTAPNLPRPSFDPSSVIPDEESILNWFYTNAYWIQQFGTRMGVCVPSHCSDEDVSKMITYGKYFSDEGSEKITFV